MNTPRYQVSDFLSRYSRSHIPNPEPWLYDNVVKKLPLYLTTVVDFGCANGRNFLPFNGRDFKYIGFDIHPRSSLIKITDFLYHECSIEDFIENPRQFSINWEESLVMSHGSLMYIPSADIQNNFLITLKKEGCKNFVFHEYTRSGLLSPNAKGDGLGYLHLTPENLNLFSPPNGNISHFRSGTAEAEKNISAFISLSK